MNSIKKINIRFTILVLMVLIAGFSRIIIHIDNFTPLGAMCLFGGAYFSNKWKAYLTPLLTLLLSDMVIQGIVLQGKYGFPLYEGWYWIYGSFAIMVFIGNYIIKNIGVGNIILSSIVIALIHWIITDFGVWLGGCNGLYTKDLNGFILCYMMAVPYMIKFLLGTLFYSFIMFGLFELAKKKISILKKEEGILL